MSNRRTKHAILVCIGLILTLIGFIAGLNSKISPTTPISLISLAKPDPASQDQTPQNSQPLVKRVIDGDTIELENGDKVRYIGIDTPETLDPRKPVQCFGKNASDKNKELVEGKPVWLVKDISDKDKYSRLLRYVYLGDPDQESSVFVNLELVKQGFAHSSTYPPDIKYQELFATAEKEARENQRGLWSDCPTEQGPASQDPTSLPSFPSTPPNPSYPPDLPDSPNLPSSDCKIKGNIGASGEKIYHLPGCGSYDKTAIDESRGEKWFCSEEEAQSAGWRKAKNC